MMNFSFWRPLTGAVIVRVAVGLIMLLLALGVTAKPVVLVSIKPLALIVQEVAGEQWDVETLLPVTASAHDYPLKMSDHRRLREADLVVWVGAELESFLARPLAQLPEERRLSLYELPGLFWPLASEEDHGHQHLHRHSGKDPHLWLDPRNAAQVAHAVAQRLGQLEPASAEAFRVNAERFERLTLRLDEQLSALLLPVKSAGFAVYHEGYSHFVSRYGLHQLGYVTYTPERRPGARHLQTLQNLLAKEGRCVFLEPYHRNHAIEEMTQSLGLKLGVLDPIGSPQVSSYEQLLVQMAEDFSACLADRSDAAAAH